MRAMRSATTADHTTDPAAAHPEIARLRPMLRQGHLDAARALLADRAPADRTLLIAHTVGGFGSGHTPSGRIVSGDDRLRRALRAAVAADPADTLAAVLLGGALIHHAWSIGGRSAQFRTLLCEAERLLCDAVARDPRDCAGWVLRLTTARGLSLGQAEAQRRYDRLAEIDPHHLPGQTMMLQQLCPRWGGSLDAALGFARTAMLAAPEGAPNAALVVEAHLERLTVLSSKDRTRQIADGRLHEEIRAAAARSVDHPAFTHTCDWIRVRTVFAMMFGLLGDRAAATRQVDALGPLAGAAA
jgi:hypothetical protein